MTGQPDLRAAARALDDVIAMAALANSTLEEALKAAIQARDALLGEPALDLAAAQANPYGSEKHGVYDALSAAAVAEDVPGWDDPLPGDPHLPESKGGQDGCTHPGCHDHMPAPTREADAAELAAHAPVGAL